MSEETTTPVEAPQIAEGTRSPVESKVSTEVAPNKSQNQDLESPDYGALVQESKKYRARAQQSESDLANLQKQIDADRQKQMEEQNEWQQLAEERAFKLSELVPIANNPAVPSNEVPQDWTKMNRSDRVKHWDKIVESYRQNK